MTKQFNIIRSDYSVLWGMGSNKATENNSPFKSNEEARAMRDAVAERLKAEGYNVRRSILPGQLRQYWSFGVSCGEVCNVYSLEAIK